MKGSGGRSPGPWRKSNRPWQELAIQRNALTRLPQQSLACFHSESPAIVMPARCAISPVLAAARGYLRDFFSRGALIHRDCQLGQDKPRRLATRQKRKKKKKKKNAPVSCSNTIDNISGLVLIDSYSIGCLSLFGKRMETKRLRHGRF